MTNRLSPLALPHLPQDVLLPAYDRKAVTPGIVHLGVGAFHRAHQAVFIDDCLARGETGWGIVAASLRGPDTRDAIAPQDNLYTFCLRDGENEKLRIIGSILETIVAPEDPERLLQAMADPRVRIVTLTVTEKGYLADLSAGALLLDHPDVVHDLAHPQKPRSALGFLLEATRRRRAGGAVPLTLLSCDNLPSNGRILHRLLVEMAGLTDKDLAAFIAENLSCPCVMVDRIVPATTAADRERVAARLECEDAWPVIAEPYFRWVIEDRFPHGRPGIELSGAELVEDVEPYEHMKLRMLNGAHTAMAAIGQCSGLETIADIYADPRVRGYIDRYWREVGSTLSPAVSGPDYVAGLRQRFANPVLRHRAAQIASDASLKVPQRILAPLAELRAAGAPNAAAIVAVAMWIRSCAALNERGEPVVMADPAFAEWGLPIREGEDEDAVIDRFLSFRRVFGPEWQDDETFVTALRAAYRDIVQHGALHAIDRHLSEE
ncbi:mannitol dehydrogenase family protein [Rhizobium sp. GR12]|uniref:mannitol dehydrogenase family protein n=1 Tax=Rhizobium sp. GR12 TaxID=3053925 RepID=UPI002FBE3BB8